MSGRPLIALRGLLAATMLSTALPARAAAPNVDGLWLTDDGKAVVQIAPCGERRCGRIARVLDTGAKVPKTDVNNPDARQRGRALLGLQVLSGFTQSAAAWENGRAYDPKTGNSYKSSLKLNADGSLRLTGCVLFVCRSKRWTRSR